MRAKVTGENVGYAYIFAGYIDKASNSIYVADMDYLESPDSREVGGVYYPDWGDTGSFTLEFDWEPLTFAITDGKTTAQALLMPRSYGAAPEEAVYTVDGIYTFADGTTSRALASTSATASCARCSASPARTSPARRTRSPRRPGTGSPCWRGGWT